MDSVLNQLVQSQLLSTIDDMGQVLARNAASREIAEERDFAIAIVREHGEVVALDNLVHLGAVADTAARIQELFQFGMKAGDVILSNDPYSGGTHVQDFTVLAPFHHKREAICYLVCRAHLPDLGGQVQGGYFPFADDVWAEGSRIPPLKIVQEGKIIGDKLDAVVINSRCPDLFTISLQAMLAALTTGQSRLEVIIKKYGSVNVKEAMRASIAATEIELATAMSGWQHGTYEGVSVIDHDVKRGDPLEIRAVLTVSADKLIIDLSDSSSQSPGFVNSTRSNTVGYALVALYAGISGRAPVNSGLLARTQIVTKEGTLVQAAFPAAVGWGPYHPGAEIICAVSSALSHILPGEVTILGTKPMMLVAHWRSAGLSFPLHTLLRAGASASRGVDGWGTPGPLSRGLTPSVEALETERPIMVEKLELAGDSAGLGHWRGGFGLSAEFSFTSPAVVDVIVEGRQYPIEASVGGTCGGSNGVEIDGQAVERVAWNVALPNARLSAWCGGGGGWGKPEEREAQSIQRDIDDELVSADIAAVGAEKNRITESWAGSPVVKVQG